MYEIVSFANDRQRVSLVLRRNQFPTIDASVGQTLYAIKHGDRYFSWCYTTKVAADAVAGRLTYDGNPSNWVVNTNRCILSSITSENDLHAVST